jgi:hypothetical protein
LAKISYPTAGFSCWERFSSPTAQVLADENALGCWRSHSFLQCECGLPTSSWQEERNIPFQVEK